MKNLSIPVLLIDHHRIHPETEGQVAYMIVDEEATSTAEIIYRLWKESKFNLDRQEAMAIFLGIVYDTRRLALSNSGTFRIIMDLIECGVDVQEAFKLISVPLELSEKIARLKAVKRARIHRIDQWIVAVSKISTFQASAARALIGVGADVSIVGGVKDDELRVSLRSTGDFFEKTNIHLGRDLATPLGKEIGGAGGGHSTSAGANGKGDPRICLSKCLNLFREKLTANQSVG